MGRGRRRRGGGRRRVLRRRARARANDARSPRRRRHSAYPNARPYAYPGGRSRRARRRPRKPQRAGRAGRAGLPTAGQRQRPRRTASVLALRSQSAARPHAYAYADPYAFSHAHADPYAHARRRPRLPGDRPGQPQSAWWPRRNGMPDARQRRRARRRRPLLLRRAGDRNANADSNAYANPHGDAYANPHGNAHAYADSNARPRNPRNRPLAPPPSSWGRLAHRDAYAYAHPNPHAYVRLQRRARRRLAPALPVPDIPRHRFLHPQHPMPRLAADRAQRRPSALLLARFVPPQRPLLLVVRPVGLRNAPRHRPRQRADAPRNRCGRRFRHALVHRQRDYEGRPLRTDADRHAYPNADSYAYAYPDGRRNAYAYSNVGARRAS